MNCSLAIDPGAPGYNPHAELGRWREHGKYMVAGRGYPGTTDAAS